MTAQALPFVGRRPAEIGRRRLLWLALIVTSTVLYLLFAGQWTIPYDPDKPLFLAINQVRDWLDANRYDLGLFTVFIEVTGGAVRIVTDALITVLLGVGWPAVLAVAAFLGYAAGGWRVGVLAPLGLALVGALGLWEGGMETLGLTLSAVFFSLLLGIPLGILDGPKRPGPRAADAHPRRDADHADVRVPRAVRAPVRHRCGAGGRS